MKFQPQTIEVRWTRHVGTAEDVRMNTLATFSNGLLYTDEPVFTDQQRFTYVSSEWTLDALLKTTKSDEG